MVNHAIGILLEGAVCIKSDTAVIAMNSETRHHNCIATVQVLKVS